MKSSPAGSSLSNPDRPGTPTDTPSPRGIVRAGTGGGEPPIALGGPYHGTVIIWPEKEYIFGERTKLGSVSYRKYVRKEYWTGPGPRDRKSFWVYENLTDAQAQHFMRKILTQDD